MLMAELEAMNRQFEEHRSPAYRPPSPSHSTISDSLTLVSSNPPPDFQRSRRDTVDTTQTNAHVTDWLARARESIDAFGGYIDLGDSSATDELRAIDEDEVANFHEAEDDLKIDPETADGEARHGDEGPLATFSSLCEAPMEKEQSTTNLHEAAYADRFDPSSTPFAHRDAPGPAIDRPLRENHRPPHILRCGLVSAAETERLFKM